MSELGKVQAFSTPATKDVSDADAKDVKLINILITSRRTS